MQNVDTVNWTQVAVREIISSSDSFQRAKEKLKRAETVTDVNTDSDELLAKKQRRVAAAKNLKNSDHQSSSEEEDSFTELVPPFPRQPMVRQQSCGNKSAVHYSKGDISSRASSQQSSQLQLQSEEQDCLSHSSHSNLSQNSRLSRTDTLSQTIKKKGVQNLSYSTDFIRRNNNSLSDSENESGLEQVAKNAKETAHKSSISIAQDDKHKQVENDASFKKYILKTLTDIKYKVNIIIANQNDERDVCTTCKRKRADDQNEDEAGENPFISMFPIKNDEELQTLERFLIDEQNRAKLKKQLQKLGGQNVKHTVQNMLKKCFALEFAQTFSWLGRRNKKQFSEMRFCTIVTDVVQKHYPDATNTFICTFIKEWLRRAPEKCGKHANEETTVELHANDD